jgi:hypothetical protein
MIRGVAWQRRSERPQLDRQAIYAIAQYVAVSESKIRALVTPASPRVTAWRSLPFDRRAIADTL